MQLPYKTKQNQQNNKNKVENDIIVEVIVCHCCRFGCCCFDVVSNQNQQTKTNICKTYTNTIQNKTKTNKTTFIYILLLLFILVYFIGSKIAKRISKLRSQLWSQFFWLQSCKENLINDCNFRATFQVGFPLMWL